MKLNISTHTLTWSVTAKSGSISIKTTDFNSHAHVERDTGRVVFTEFNGISTHTLTWSVTQNHPKRCSRKRFQLTRSRGA